MAEPRQPIREMIEEKNEMTRQQLQANVQISHNWKTAVASGEFKGNVAIHIATLLDFLEKENAKAIAAYEAAFPAVPEFGKKPENQPAPEPAGAAA